jgi:hypothetical protein
MNENYYALAVSILRKCTPEQHLNCLRQARRSVQSEEPIWMLCLSCES